jgi:hypothetical protein
VKLFGITTSDGLFAALSAEGIKTRLEQLDVSPERITEVLAKMDTLDFGQYCYAPKTACIFRAKK